MIVLIVSVMDDDVGSNQVVVYFLVGFSDKFKVDGVIGDIIIIVNLVNF